MAPEIMRDLNPRASTSLEIPNTGIKNLLEELSLIDGKDLETLTARASLFAELAKQQAFPSLEPLLPLVLNLNGRPYSTKDHYPFAPLFRLLMPKNLVLKTGRQVSKTLCVSETNKVILANGKRVRGDELKIGDNIIGIDAQYRSQSVRVLDTIRHPGKQVFRVTTRTGAVVELADTHPLLKVSGWTPGANLRVGDRICAISRGGYFGAQQTDPVRIVLAAYSIKYAPEKSLPDWVFDLSREDATLFLRELWAIAGTIKFAANKQFGPTICYRTTSRELAFDLKSLLLKFGVPTAIKVSKFRQNRVGGFVRCAPVYTLRVVTQKGCQQFLAGFNVADKLPANWRAKPENFDTPPIEVRALINEISAGVEPTARSSAVSRGGLLNKVKQAPAFAELAQRVESLWTRYPAHPKLPELDRLTSPDIIWDKIEKIELLGVLPCWDIEVSGEHNYVVDGIVNHNSTSLAAHGVVVANCIPFFKTLYVTPLFEQIRRFSNNYVRSFIDQSPIKNQWCGTDTENNVLQRSFKNKSIMIFSFALLDANRVRGVSSDRVVLDEIQDIDPDHIPIIQETMSYSRYALTHMAGTPKSLDNPLEGSYRRSSAAEWFIPCESCRHWNIPSIEHDLDAMIGPYNVHISEKYPGTICAKCRKPINPRHGRWVHRYPDRRWQFAGYHVPQMILPLHFADPEKWATLLLKREGFGNMTQAQFYNEVMGESIDAGQKLISETELRAACILPWANAKEPDRKCFENLTRYKHRVLAVDWGGGGEAGISFTVLAVLGFQLDGSIDVIWAKKLFIGGDHLAEAVECMKYSNLFNCDFVAHDYTGAGTVRETVMAQAGFNLDRVMAMRLVRSASQDFCVYKAPTAINHRAHYSLDKTRSLLYTCQAIKLKQVKFFEYDWKSQDQPGLIADFLALTENKQATRNAGDIYTITRNTLLSDDFAQAVNLGCAALWHINDAVPNFAELAGVARLSAKVIAAENPDNWADDDMAGQFFSGY